MKSPFHGLVHWFTRSGLRIPAFALLLLTPGGSGFLSPAWAQTENDGVEILTRGPVHEAFAATINFKAVEGLIAPQAPPEVIQEIPPDQRPEGDNVTWIPGYWAWDEESKGFLWVSGIWRNLPPGRQWIPGYWWESPEGHQWISGYWADAETEEVEYLSEPPASLEAGPNVAAPSKNHSWIPGTWRWQESQYAWQAGYWNEVQPDWVWVPAYYSWAPQGWLYVDGYYDYDIPRRGLVFAPVRFSGVHFARADYSYRPSTVISLSVFTNHLFLRPQYRHYYFGDYYAPQYRKAGYYTSFNYYSGGYGYDPIYAHERWRHRDDERWERRYEDNFAYYRDNESARPPRTLAALGAFLSRPDRNRRVESDFAIRLDQLNERRDSPVRLRKVGEAEQRTFTQRGREIRNFGDQRRNQGGRNADRSPGGNRANNDDDNKRSAGAKSVKVKMPKSPVMATATAGDNLPPARPNASSPGAADGQKGRSPDRETPDKRPDNKDRENPRGKPVPDSPADPGDPRRSGRAGDPKEMPKPDRDDPPAKEMPKIEPKDRVREMPKPDSGKSDRSDPKPDEQAQPPSREEPRQPGRRPEADPSPKREDDAKADERPPTDPRRTGPPAKPKAESQREEKKEPNRASRNGARREPNDASERESRPDPRTAPKGEPKVEPKREPRAEPKGEPKREPKAEPKAEPKRETGAQPQREAKAEPKREPKAASRAESKPGPKREAPSPPRQQPKAAPRDQPKAPATAPAPAKPKKDEAAQTGDKKEKKKGNKD
jgi:hypothetical protein